MMEHRMIIKQSGLLDFVTDMQENIKPATEMPEPFQPSVDINELESNKKGNPMSDFLGDGDNDLGLSDDSEDIETENEDIPSFDYLDSHLDFARIILIQMDKIMSFGMYLFSGVDDWQKYRLRKNEPDESSDYESKALATIFKKHNFRMSIEFMFISLFLGAYTMNATRAYQDRKEKKGTKKGSSKTDSQSIDYNEKMK